MLTGSTGDVVFNSMITSGAGHALSVLAGVMLTVAFVMMTWTVFNALTPSVDDNHEIQHNMAYALNRIAILIAQVIGMTGAIKYYVGSPSGTSLVTLLYAGAFTTVFLVIMRYVVDGIVLHGIDNVHEMVTNRNMAVAVAEAGLYLGLGVLVNGALNGQAPNVTTAILSSLVFGGLGVLVVLVVSGIYSLAKRTNSEIANGNLSAGILVGSLGLAVAMAIQPGVSGDFVGWSKGLQGFAAVALMGLLLLSVTWLLTLIVMRLSGRTKSGQHLITEQVWAMATVRATLLLIAGFVVMISVSQVQLAS